MKQFNVHFYTSYTCNRIKPYNTAKFTESVLQRNKIVHILPDKNTSVKFQLGKDPMVSIQQTWVNSTVIYRGIIQGCW